jgi:hypothetical protein
VAAGWEKENVKSPAKPKGAPALGCLQEYVRARLLQFFELPGLSDALGHLKPTLQQAAARYTEAAASRTRSSELVLVFKHDCQ